MMKEKTSYSFRDNLKKEEGIFTSTARIQMNNSSYNSHIKMNGMSGLFDMNYFNSYHSDLKKTFLLNIDILKQYITSNNNQINSDNKIISLVNSVLESYKKRQKIIEKLKEKKSKILIDNQINTEKKRKNEERRFYLRDKIKENEERILNKEEYMKVLHKKMREVEIYIHKNTLKIKNTSKRKRYQTFSMFNFIETNNDLIKQKKDLKKQIEDDKNSYKTELEENKKIKQEEQKENEKKGNEQNKINDNNDELKVKNFNEKYKKKIKLMTLKLNLLKNTYKKVHKKIKILNIKALNQIDNKEDDKDGRIETEQSKLQMDTTIKNSFMDFSIVLNAKNVDESKFDMSKIGNNFGNISNFGVYDISIIDYK